GDALLDHAACAPPRLPLHPPDVVVERTAIAAELDVPSPAAEPRLRHDRQGETFERRGAVQPPRARVWDADRAEQPRGDQLVVGGKQRRRTVEDANALGLEL